MPEELPETVLWKASRNLVKSLFHAFDAPRSVRKFDRTEPIDIVGFVRGLELVASRAKLVMSDR